VEHFFRGFGKIRDVVLKNGFGFVEFSDSKDAEDAVHDLNNRELCGDRVIVEMSRRAPRSGGGGFGGGRSGGGYGDRRNGGGGSGSRYGPPMQTRYRLTIENLSSRCSWQDLKDLMRDTAEVTYADAHKKTQNEGIVCFASHDDLRRAMDRYQGKEINGRRIKLIDDTEGGRRKSRSRSPRGRSRSPRGRSRSPRGRSRSPRGRSKSRSRSPRSRSRSSRSSRSRSHSPKRSRSPPSAKSSRSRSPAENGKRSP